MILWRRPLIVASASFRYPWMLGREFRFNSRDPYMSYAIGPIRIKRYIRAVL